MGSEPASQGRSGTPLVSIVMPCYRVADHLGAAIASVEAQTFTDWELICVDDGSPDEVAGIVQDAAVRDGRIRLVRHERNRGLAAARNTGLAAARGAFVWMPDADDRFESVLLERALAALADSRCDLVVFGCREEYLDGSGAPTSERVLLPPHPGIFTGGDLHREVLGLEEATLYGYAWNKVYRRTLIADLAFEDVPLIEDILFNIAVLDRARGAALVDEPLYVYGKRTAGNLTGRFVPRYFEVHRRRIQELWDQQIRWSLDGGEVRARLGTRLVRYSLSALERNCDPRAGMTGADRARWCRELIADPLFKSLVLDDAPEGPSTLTRMGAAVLRSRSTLLYRAVGRLLHLLRRGMSGGYAKVRRGSEVS